MPNQYHDKRGDFFRSYYEKGLVYEQYLLTGKSEQQSRWKSYAKQLAPTEKQRQQVGTFVRKMPVLCLSGIWCGDCARQGPMLHALEEMNNNLSVRFLDNRTHPELQEELRINGAEKVPVVVSFSEDFYELSRFGDRHLSFYRQKVATELGAACDAGFGTPQAELTVEFQEWIDYFERLQLMLRLSPALRKRYGD